MVSSSKPTAHSAASTRSSKQDSRTRGGAKGKGGAGQDAKDKGEDAAKTDVPSSHLTEVDREWFNIRIKDLEEKLAR